MKPFTFLRNTAHLTSTAPFTSLFSLLSLLVLIVMAPSCGHPSSKDGKSSVHYWKGVDIGWCTEMEARGLKLYDREGNEMECTALMKSLGCDAIRIRVWVDPTAHGGWCSVEDVLEKARRAKANGMAVMVDFHYSDFWADPNKQNIPASWSGKTYEEVKELLYAHTVDVLSALRAEGIEPLWVQVGNETSHGLLWSVKGNEWGDPIPDENGKVTILESQGRLETQARQYAGFIDRGYEAVKSVFPDAKVIVHLDNGFNPDLYDSNLDSLKKYGARWDMTGMSMYPYWAIQSGLETDPDESITHCIENISHVWGKYSTPVMIVETGFVVDESDPSVMAEGERLLGRLITESRSLGEACQGIFYWEPECRPSQYRLGAFDSRGYPTVIMNAFSK